MDEDKRKACQRVLHTLRNPLMLMSIEDREDALQLARKHAITAEELLMAALKNAKEA
jgi:hypothetical protein